MSVRIKSISGGKTSISSSLSKGTIQITFPNEISSKFFSKEEFTQAGEILFSTGPQSGNVYLLSDILNGTVPGFAGITLDSLASPAADLDLNNNRIVNLADPVNPQDAVTLNFTETTYLRLDGTTNTTAPFDAIDGSSAAPSFTFQTDATTGLFLKAPNEMGIAVGGTELASLGTSFKLVDGSAASPAYSFTNNVDTGLFHDTGAIGVSVDGNQVARFDASSIEYSMVSHMGLPSGTTAQRPIVPAVGMFRYNTDIGNIEFYTGASWDNPITSGSINAVLKTGDTMTGALTVSGNPVYTDNFMFESANDTGITYSAGALNVQVSGKIVGTFANDSMTLIGDAAYPVFTLDSNLTASGASVSSIITKAPNAASTDVTFGRIELFVDDNTSGSETATQKLRAMNNGVLTDVLEANGTAIHGYGFRFKQEDAFLHQISPGEYAFTINGFDAITMSDKLVVGGTAGIVIPEGTTAQRDNVEGILRINTDTNLLEAYINGSWVSFMDNTASGFLPLTGGTLTGTLTASGILNTIGDATAPSYSFSGHTGTGFYHPNVREGVNLSVNGVDSFTVDDGSTNQSRARFHTSDALSLPQGTTAERPSVPTNGDIRYNAETGHFEGYQNGQWLDFDLIGGAGTVEKLLGSATIDFASGGITTIYTVPGGETHVITKVVCRVVSVNAGAAPTPADVSVGSGGVLKNNIVGNTTVNFGGTLISVGKSTVLDTIDGAVSPDGGDTVDINVQTPAGGTLTDLDVSVYVFGFVI